MNPTPSRITEEARALIQSVQQTLDAGPQVLRGLGVDPAKVKAMGRALTPAQQKQAEEAVGRDLAEIDQEVAEARARLAARERSPLSPKAPRRFV